MIIRGAPVWQRWVLGALGVIAVGTIAWPYTVDDAYIVARYARNLAHGNGYGFNAAEPSDGVTGPLWVLPGWLAVKLGWDSLLVMKAVGLASMALAVSLVLRRLSQRQRGTVALAFALPLLLVQPELGTWGVAGLETGAATLLLCVATLAVTKRPRAAPRLAGVCIGALAWLRPELAFAAGALLVTLSLRDVRAMRVALVTALPIVAGLIAWRVASFGSVLPLSYAAKAGSIEQGGRYSLQALLICTGVAGLGLATYGALRGRSDDRVLAFVCIAHGVAVCLAGGDWMPGFRLFVPILPLYVVLAAVGCERMARSGRGRWVALACCVVACAITSADLVTRLEEMRHAGRTRDAVATVIAARLARDATRVALVDIGALTYASDLAVIDLGGLTNPAIARLPGGHLDKRVSSAWLRAQEPDAVLLHSAHRVTVDAEGEVHDLRGYPIENRVARMPWLRDDFYVAETFVYGAHYHYVLWLRKRPL